MLRVLFVSALIFLPFFARANVVINEVAWMGTLPKLNETLREAADNEWIELFNSGNESVSLKGWKIVGENSTPNILLSGTIPAGGYFLLERGNDDVVVNMPADIIYPYKNNALSNSGEHLFLKNTASDTVDELNFAAGWPAGDNTTKETMQRAGSQWVTATGTPRAVNAGVAEEHAFEGNKNQSIPPLVPAPAPSQTESDSRQSSSAHSTDNNWYTPLLKVYGGDDTRAAVGTWLEFVGYAVGLKNEPVGNARFIWNFGDGETKEGRIVSHIYQIPGKYTVSLSAATGEHTAADYHIVEVMPNQITVGGVLGGEKGFIRFVNPSSVDIDIGGWLVDDGDAKRFVVPAHTKIAPRAEIAFANEVTGLLQGKRIYPITLMFPNAVPALQKFPELLPMPIAVASSTQSDSLITQTEEHSSSHPTVKSINKNTASLARSEPEHPEKKEIIQNASSSELASVSAETQRSPLFFGVAFLVSLAGAFGFLAIKKFLL